jgi:hypothetical protein
VEVKGQNLTIHINTEVKGKGKNGANHMVIKDQNGTILYIITEVEGQDTNSGTYLRG